MHIKQLVHELDKLKRKLSEELEQHAALENGRDAAQQKADQLKQLLLKTEAHVKNSK